MFPMVVEAVGIETFIFDTFQTNRHLVGGDIQKAGCVPRMILPEQISIPSKPPGMVDLNPVLFPGTLNYTLTYAYNQNNGSREIYVDPISDTRIANADYQGELYGTAFETGYGIKIGQAVITPLSSSSYSYLHEDKYAETSAGASGLLTSRPVNHNTWRFGLGGKLETEKECPFGLFTPSYPCKIFVVRLVSQIGKI